ncbi:hypothetical protein MD484_g3284, partial [Candolleomyces efflorescens]
MPPSLITPASSVQTFWTANLPVESNVEIDLAVVEAFPDAELDLVVKKLPDVDESNIDPRLDLSVRPSSEELDEGLSRQLSNIIYCQTSRTEDGEKQSSRRSEEEPLYVEFKENDPRNPINYSRRRKWVITWIACTSTMLSSTTVSSYNMGFGSMTRDLNATVFQATIGLSLFTLGFGVIPMITASFSEEFGRRPLYIVSMLGFLLMYVMVAE